MEKTGLTLKCSNCGVVFYRFKSAAMVCKTTFCSIKCRSEARREKRPCAICGTVFQIKKSSGIKTCSEECHKKILRRNTKEEVDGLAVSTCKNGTKYISARENGKAKIKYLHRYVAEKVTGIKLKSENVVHHIDLNRQNNDKSNLIILQNQAEHAALHRRLRVLNAGGNPKTQKICCMCKVPKNKTEFYFSKSYCESRSYGSTCKECFLSKYPKNRKTKKIV